MFATKRKTTREVWEGETHRMRGGAWRRCLSRGCWTVLRGGWVSLCSRCVWRRGRPSPGLAPSSRCYHQPPRPGQPRLTLASCSQSWPTTHRGHRHWTDWSSNARLTGAVNCKSLLPIYTLYLSVSLFHYWTLKVMYNDSILEDWFLNCYRLEHVTLVMSLGAGLPGMRAVVMMMSTSLHCLANSAISASMNSFDMVLA